VWDNLLFGLRLPGLPGGAKVVVTGTPTPTPFIKTLSTAPSTKLVTGSTYENLDNLDPTFRKAILEAYEGTHKGQQELHGHILQELKDSLWKLDMIHYEEPAPDPKDMDRIVVSVDPAGSIGKKSDETGIIAVGIIGKIGYVLSDLTGKYTPEGWARSAVELYRSLAADAIVAEKNFGGDMVRTTIEHYLEHVGETARIIVTTASRSKELRAEPIVGLYEQGRVMHHRGLVKLEEEMLSWIPGKGRSPNRVDALVHGFTELFRSQSPGAVARPSAKAMPSARRTGILGGIPRTRRSIFDPR
jgi:phage terminase large subunit-like protein